MELMELLEKQNKNIQLVCFFSLSQVSSISPPPKKMVKTAAFTAETNGRNGPRSLPVLASLFFTLRQHAPEPSALDPTNWVDFKVPAVNFQGCMGVFKFNPSSIKNSENIKKNTKNIR